MPAALDWVWDQHIEVPVRRVHHDRYEPTLAYVLAVPDLTPPPDSELVEDEVRRRALIGPPLRWCAEGRT